VPSFAEFGHLVTVGTLQAGLGLAVWGVLWRLYRMSHERYLMFWALEWLVMSAMSAIGVVSLLIGTDNVAGLALGLVAVLVGYLQPTALGLAAMSLAAPRAGASRDRAFSSAAMACGFLLTALAGVLSVPVQIKILIAVVPSHLFCAATNIWFAWAFARVSPHARTQAGRLVIGFSLLYALHLLVNAIGWSGMELYPNPTAPAVIGLLLPMGITSGIVLAVLQDAAGATARLRESEATNRGLLAALPDMLVVLDHDGVYRDFLPAKDFAPLLPPESFLGRCADDVLPAELARLQRLHLARVVATGETQVYEYALPGPGGAAHFEARLAPSGPGRVIGIVRDVTARRLAERERERLIAELEHKNDELATKNAELERFTYTVSHDLRSPLVTILGFLGFVEKAIDAGDPRQAHDDLDRVRAAAVKMDQFLRELLELSRIGRVAMPSQEVDTGALAREVVALLDTTIRERGARVVIADDLPTVTADRVRLREVLQNLLENALRFTAKATGPLVAIGSRGRDPSGRHVLYVSDTGIGVDPIHHERIFGLFEKLDPGSEGTGVGLALVRRIVEVHGGRVWVESEGRGHGATFCFTLPDTDPARVTPSPGAP
jgi:two-component system, LuxR family, sensor kinase FixL